MNLKTSCKDCFFAKYDGVTQVGCAADRLQLFDVAECYDEEREFFVTKKYPCLMYRTEKWAKNAHTKDISKLVEIARKQLNFPYVVITSGFMAEDKIHRINEQKIAPKSIFMYWFEKRGEPIRQPNLTNVYFSEKFKDPVERLIKRVRNNTNILFLDDNFILPSDLIEKIDTMVNDHICLKAVLKSKTSDSFIMPTILRTVYPFLTHTRILEEFEKHNSHAVGFLEDIHELNCV